MPPVVLMLMAGATHRTMTAVSAAGRFSGFPVLSQFTDN